MIILGRYGDMFTQSLFEQMRTYKEKVSYYPYSYRLFANDELLSRFSDPPYSAITARGSIESDADIRFSPGSKKLRDSIKNDSNVVLVVRGASGTKWKPVHEIFNTYFSSKYLKKEMKAVHVTAVLPNMPFGKQDHLFYDEEELIDGAPITLKYARELLKEYADLLISFNPHDYRDKTGWIVKNENTITGAKKDEQGRILDSKGRVYLPEPEDWTGFAYAIDAMPLLAKYVIDLLHNPLLIGPDRSVENAVKKFSDKVLVADKIRDKHERLNVDSKISLYDDMRVYDAILFDDTIQAGTTMNNIVQELRLHEKPPRSITCASVHGEFVYNRKLEKSAYDILVGSGARIIVTDTIETPVSKVSVVPLLAEELNKLV
jgi:phosphoribosylpyrophosphate synthetase